MKQIFKTSKLMLMSLVGFTFLWSSCSTDKNKETENTTVKTAEKVRIMPIQMQNLTNTYEFTSTLQAYEEVYYAPASPGRINKINVEVSSRFNEGDILVEMDQTQLHQARIQLKNLEVDMARFDTLIRTNSIPRQQYDQLKTQLEIARTNVQFLEDNNKLKAPFSGIVSGKYYQNGEMFSGAPNTTVGKAAVLSLVQINPLKVIVNITEQLFPLIHVNMTANVVTDIFPDKIFTGRVLRIHPTIDQISRTFRVEVVIPNSNETLRPGMFCRTTFMAGETEALIVPTLAVLKVQGSNERFIFIEENGKAKRVSVTIGRRFDDKVELLTNGIQEGDRLIVSGQSRLVDGVSVEVIE
ncbi:MAG: efflux RND transporter periplasmic adaptor subunit [Bacteroidales bacterium]|nr:efflux RND transporter periplasmic adaptor subunit [Bacteroidales bacterium]